MSHSYRSLPHLLYLAFAAVLLFGTGQAHAKRGFAIINTGSTFSELAPLKKENLNKLNENERLEVQMSNYDTVGYQYSRFGIFWLDIWNWSGEYIVYNKVSENGGIVTPAQAALLMGVEESKLPKPLNYRMPFGLMILVGLLSLKIVPRIIAKKRASQPMAQYEPSRPQWTPQNPPPGAPGNPVPPPAGGPPPVPPPLPPDQQ